MRKRLKHSPLRKKAKRGFRGYPVATIAFYGSTDASASKVAVGIVLGENQEPSEMRKWFSESSDLRSDIDVATEILDFIKGHDVRSVAMSDRIIGCPHEEVVDYPEGQECPECPFWHGKDRWTGESVH